MDIRNPSPGLHNEDLARPRPALGQRSSPSRLRARVAPMAHRAGG